MGSAPPQPRGIWANSLRQTYPEAAAASAHASRLEQAAAFARRAGAELAAALADEAKAARKAASDAKPLRVRADRI